MSESTVSHAYLPFKDPVTAHAVNCVYVHTEHIGHFSRVYVLVEFFTKLLQPAVKSTPKQCNILGHTLLKFSNSIMKRIEFQFFSDTLLGLNR